MPRKGKVLCRSAPQPLQPAEHSTPPPITAATRLAPTRVSVGFCTPQFELPEPLTGKIWTLDDFEDSPALLVMFICNHCPFVKHLKKDIAKLTSFYIEKGLASMAISSNSIVTYPKDGPEYMAEEAKLYKYSFPYLYDESQEVAKAFRAVCTPEFYLFKKDDGRPFELFYHGQFDDSRPTNNVSVTGRDLSRAIDCALSGEELPFYQTLPENRQLPTALTVGIAQKTVGTGYADGGRLHTVIWNAGLGKPKKSVGI